MGSLIAVARDRWRRIRRVRKRLRRERAYWRRHELDWAVALALLTRRRKSARARLLARLAEPDLKVLRSRRDDHY
jgi:hypothetical protein